MRLISRIIVVLLFWTSAFGADFYISQNPAGNNDGSSCSNARAVTWFNNSGNWANPKQADKIGPLDTVHLCGTFTGAANASPMLTIQGSGTNVSPITILFETGSKLEAPYWGATGAINLNGKSYITIDGGSPCGIVSGSKVECNGIIQNTLAGSSGLNCPGGTCTYVLNDSASSFGIYNGGKSIYVEIKNLQIGPMYTRSLDTKQEGFSTASVINLHNEPQYTSIHNNVLKGAGKLVIFAYSDNTANDQSGYYIHNNYFSEQCWAIGIGGNTDIAGFKDIQIFENEITDWRWAQDNVGGACHTNGTMLFNGWGAKQVGYIGDANSKIYNNYLHGSLSGGYSGSSPSGFISCQDNCGPVKVFNNVIIDTETSGTNGGGAIYMQSGGSGGHGIYNNTIIRPNANCINVTGDRFGNPLIKNNLMIGCSDAFETYRTIPNVFTSDYNLGYNIKSSWLVYNLGGSGQWVSLATWKSAYGQDIHSITSNANLNPGYKPTTGSPALGAGVNLTSLGIPELNLDKDGVPRSSSGAWDIGAYGVEGEISGPKNLRILN